MVFYQFITRDFAGVAEVELFDMLSCLTELASIYEDCYLEARDMKKGLVREKSHRNK